MTRPSPPIIERHTNAKWQSIEVVEPEARYAICRNGDPIQLRTKDELKPLGHYKYLNSTFAYPAHAHKLAARLNDFFKTNIYAVYTLEPRALVRPPEVVVEDTPYTRRVRNRKATAFLQYYRDLNPDAPFPVYQLADRGRVIFEDETVQDTYNEWEDAE
ncbi:hypothetical protein C8J25_101846 [Sphingomonas faeni]|uniref:Uncharacterized protein n=1 Tax=Sphingomonas faeni TaxID=185950 RepID=A0A2T5UCW0_9SPHN|nr:hypothetical protein [Sphingomonas faeni]PTW49338.1 hypothetical protein C8J25_101846 [Sphingomonas faeni]